jgi:YidC/Oxa1 family membrane protein insertase
MENKNTIIAIVLMLVVWLGFSLFFPQQQPPQTVAPAQVEPASNQGQVGTPETSPQQTIQGFNPASQAVAGTTISVPDREIVIETELYQAVFSNVGGLLKRFTLKRFQETPSEDSALVSVFTPGSNQRGSLLTTGSDHFNVFNDARYQTDAPSEIILGPGETREIHFITSTESGARIEKIYSFHGDKYPFELSVQLSNPGNNPLRGKLALALIHPWDESMAGDHFDHVGPISLVGEKVETIKVDKLSGSPQGYGGDTIWSGFETKYFLAAGVPLEGAADKILVSRTGDLIENKLETPFLTIEPGSSRAFNYLFYFGPRDIDILNSANHQLAKAIDFGFFSLLALPLLHVLKFFYSFVGNYGIAIVVLTILIKLLFWPLTQKSYASMKGMQKLQPEMQKIREKHKNDRERINREMMELYKTHRVNPVGGCLPMVVQIPVFFALYKVLLNSIELRHAHFGLWLTDLSAKDPYYITPLIMGATMFIQQKMSPTTMDPTQAKIFMVMPVVFTFLFLNFPSGLVIYWLVNNLLTILQQYFINRKPA